MQVLMDTMNVKIFNENGSFITEMNYTQQALLSISEHGKSYFHVKNSGLDLKLFGSLNSQEVTESDFQKAVSGKTKISLSPFCISAKKYKIVAEGILYCPESAMPSHEFSLIVYNSKLSSNTEINAKNSEAFTPTHTFEILYGKNEEFVDLELKEIK